jgi:hypothetical protein
MAILNALDVDAAVAGDLPLVSLARVLISCVTGNHDFDYGMLVVLVSIGCDVQVSAGYPHFCKLTKGGNFVRNFD